MVSLKVKAGIVGMWVSKLKPLKILISKKSRRGISHVDKVSEEKSKYNREILGNVEITIN